jgi:hypothetical protein
MPYSSALFLRRAPSAHIRYPALCSLQAVGRVAVQLRQGNALLMSETRRCNNWTRGAVLDRP